ncbi:hypothetical protein [Streptomyces sp. NBC_01803]|uniref:hypothetical protein n=1 Tax=Streptomyces sp. NBC_01803 TaxID=2975946 RepID=UPI002DD7C7D2|nr:hypothetical protein [Streptomyces sp. NBC_01803]WSA44808.1 hypothetical protein OIE51_11695 [Streptomyces sp. NBC_01803]
MRSFGVKAAATVGILTAVAVMGSAGSASAVEVDLGIQPTVDAFVALLESLGIYL